MAAITLIPQRGEEACLCSPEAALVEVYLIEFIPNCVLLDELRNWWIIDTLELSCNHISVNCKTSLVKEYSTAV